MQRRSPGQREPASGAPALSLRADSNNADFLPFSMGMLVFLMGFGVAIVRHGALPRWMGWGAIVISLTAITPAFFVAGIGGAILIVVSSVMLAMRARSPQRT